MGRIKNQIPCYYWISSATGKRISWFFPSTKQANDWRNARYYKFVDYYSIEEFLKSVPKSRQVREREVWIRHRDGFRDSLLKRGKVVI